MLWGGGRTDDDGGDGGLLHVKEGAGEDAIWAVLAADGGEQRRSYYGHRTAGAGGCCVNWSIRVLYFSLPILLVTVPSLLHPIFR